MLFSARHTVRTSDLKRLQAQFDAEAASIRLARELAEVAPDEPPLLISLALLLFLFAVLLFAGAALPSIGSGL